MRKPRRGAHKRAEATEAEPLEARITTEGKGESQPRPLLPERVQPPELPVVRIQPSGLPAIPLEEEVDLDPLVEHYARRSKAENSLRAYKEELTRFAAWCQAKGVRPLPANPNAICNYLIFLASFGREPELDALLKRVKPLKPSSIERALSAISKKHSRSGFAREKNPCATEKVQETLQGIRNDHGARRAKRTPILADDVWRLVGVLPDSPMGVRDKAVLLVGWMGAFRRSELVALKVEDLAQSRDPGAPHGSLIATVRRSKTDQPGVGLKKAIHAQADVRVCPVAALRAWLAAAGIESGHVFRPFAPDKRTVLDKPLSDDMVYEIVGKYAARAGLSSGDFGGFGGHSLRAGFATQAAMDGKSMNEIMMVTGHKKVDTVMEYIRTSQLFSERAAGRGLLDRAPEPEVE